MIIDINIIAAIGKNYELGYRNQLPWSLPNDLRYFRKLTLKSAVVMGRKTYQSIGKPLPNRLNIVISKTLFKEVNTLSFKNFDNLIVIPSIESLFEIMKNDDVICEKKIFVIGGASLYSEFLLKAKKLYLTFVDGFFNADVFFPKLDLLKWTCIDEIHHHKDDRHKFNYTFTTWIRK